MDCLIIGVAGGTGSGKSTFTDRLKKRFGDELAILYHDNYYRAQDDIPFETRRKVNYDHPQALETDMLIRHIKALKAGQSVECPVYDYARHTRSDRTVRVEPRRVLLVEGILVLENPELREQMDIKIYVEADADERILRRLLRDVLERGRDVEGIAAQYLATVKPMHNQFVEPTKTVADLVINGGLNDVAFDVIRAKIENYLERSRPAR